MSFTNLKYMEKKITDSHYDTSSYTKMDFVWGKSARKTFITENGIKKFRFRPSLTQYRIAVQANQELVKILKSQNRLFMFMAMVTIAYSAYNIIKTLS